MIKEECQDVLLESKNLLSDRSANSSSLALGKPLAVILNSSGQDTATPGEEFSLSITIRNQGNQSALVDVWIDAVSIAVQSWCEAPQIQLALGANVNEEVRFSFQVPIDTLPGNYRYSVIIDAQEHYPEDTPIQFAQQIQILPGTHTIVRATDPTFLLQPTTRSEDPAIVLAGSALPLQVLVQNRGDRVDRFRLVCTDLPKAWIKVIYPQGFEGSGLAMESDSLNLNPGDQGIISLLITPPIDAAAGIYIPTLRLHSENYPDLMLLDLVYVQVPPTHLLQIELRALTNRIRRQPGLFQVRLHNAGNTNRSLRLHIKELDEGEICAYTLDTDTIEVAPKDKLGVGIKVQPQKWWKRPFYGGGKVLSFSVELEDTEQLPLAVEALPGTIIWESRPWWQVLPVALLGVLGILSIAYLIWWFVFRTPPSPKIVEFSPEDSVYSALNGDSIRLGWQIRDPERLQSIRLVGLSPDGAQVTRPEVYDLSQGIPAALKPFCVRETALLSCRNVRTSARKSGTYLFEMTTMPKSQRNSASDTRKTSPIVITAIPQPKIIRFSSTQPIYQELSAPLPGAQPPASPASRLNDGSVALNWAIENPAQLGTVNLIGRSPDGVIVSNLKTYDFSQGIPAELKQSCVIQQQLICQNVATTLKKPGSYVFELVAVPKNEPSEKPEALKTEVIKIQPKPPQFFQLTLNGKPLQPAYLIPLSPGQEPPKLILSWLIDASEGSKVELLPTPGSIPLKGSIPLALPPKPGTLTIALQITSSTGQQIVRAFTIETFDPNPADPAATAAAAAANAIAAQKANGAGADSEPAAPIPNAPMPTNPDSLSPLEVPPQFNQR